MGNQSNPPAPHAGKAEDQNGMQASPLQESSHSVVVTVSDPLGLHLRSGRDVVRIASQFQAQITASNLSRNSDAVDLKSILQLMQLQARQGHDLFLAASGPDAAAAIDALCSLF
jgi:phosphotransferase system HPr (HPr) family protein